MTIEVEHEPQPVPTPDTDRFLENLQHDTAEILRVRSLLPKQELGLRVKGKLAARAQDFAALGYFERIPTTDFVWGDEEREGWENSGELGLVVHTEEDHEDGYTKGAVVMTSDGVLRKSYANDGLDGDRISFNFENATEVPLKDYPKYFDSAVKTMKHITDEKTGVLAAEYSRKRAEELAAHIQEIADENQKYGVEGAEFTSSYPEIVTNANSFMERIARMREVTAQGDRGITTEQLENVLGHVFAAQEYASNNYAIDANTYGAYELDLMAGILISSKDLGLGQVLHGLTAGMYAGAPSQSSYLVRRANRVPYRNNPDSERIYAVMSTHMINRHEKGIGSSSVPEFIQPPAEIVTEKYGTVQTEEITDWLLNQPVAEPEGQVQI